MAKKRAREADGAAEVFDNDKMVEDSDSSDDDVSAQRLGLPLSCPKPTDLSSGF